MALVSRIRPLLAERKECLVSGAPLFQENPVVCPGKAISPGGRACIGLCTLKASVDS